MQRHPPRCSRPAAHLVGLSDPVCCIDAKCASDASLLYELLSKRRTALLAHEPKHRCSRCLKESLRSADHGERPCAIVCRRGNVRFAFALCLAVALLAPIICNGADRKESGRPWIATAASNPTDRVEICAERSPQMCLRRRPSSMVPSARSRSASPTMRLEPPEQVNRLAQLPWERTPVQERDEFDAMRE